MKKLLITLVILIAIITIAWHRLAHGADDDTALKATKASYCPTISQIAKNPEKQNWYAHTPEGFWKSYHLSFATKLTQFLGSEWKGENVGRLVCYYASQQTFNLEGKQTTQATLPITLVFHTLTFVPNHGKWAHKQRGIRMCKSLKQSDCPFTAMIKHKIGNIYQEAESLKYQKSDRLTIPNY